MARIIERTYEETEERNSNRPWQVFTPLRSKKYTRKGEGEMAKTKEVFSNEQPNDPADFSSYRIFTPAQGMKSVGGLKTDKKKGDNQSKKKE